MYDRLRIKNSSSSEYKVNKTVTEYEKIKEYREKLLVLHKDNLFEQERLFKISFY